MLETSILDYLDPMNVWNRRKLARALTDMKSTVEWCKDQKLLPVSRECAKGHAMKLAERQENSM
jgi:hypothetical protein